MNDTSFRDFKRISIFLLKALGVVVGIVLVVTFIWYVNAAADREHDERVVKMRTQCTDQGGRIIQVDESEHCLIDGVDVNQWAP